MGPPERKAPSSNLAPGGDGNDTEPAGNYPQVRAARLEGIRSPPPIGAREAVSTKKATAASARVCIPALYGHGARGPGHCGMRPAAAI
jgi:hypothetical protein